jgi:two-component system LytT family response regulator
MNSTRRAVIVDDERLARKRLRDLLKAHPEINVVGEADSVETAVSMIGKECPDVVFLDVEMPPQTGFDLLPFLQKLPREPSVVFITAYENFAIRAFEVSALDYLLKPIHTERLAITVQRLLSTTKPEALEATEETWTMDSRVTLSDRRIKAMVEVSSIAAIRALGAYSRVSLVGQPQMLILRSISEWEARLPAAEFLRMDRSLIIQTRLLRKMKMVSRDKTELLLEGMPDPLDIGRVATARLKKHIRDIG